MAQSQESWRRVPLPTPAADEISQRVAAREPRVCPVGCRARPPRGWGPLARPNTSVAGITPPGAVRRSAWTPSKHGTATVETHIRCAGERGTGGPRRGPGTINLVPARGGWVGGVGVPRPPPPREGRYASPCLAGWLRADVARALGRLRSAIHGCRSLLGCDVKEITGSPDPKDSSTSYVERQNWSVRTSMRRYTRLSNGFGRKIENHMAAVAIDYFAYNFIRIHRTLRVTPAMAAGVTGRLFDVMNLVNLLIEAESKKAA